MFSMKNIALISVFTIICLGFGGSFASAKPFKFILEGEMTAEERVVMERSLDEFQYFCRSLMGSLKEDIETATASYSNRCKYCRQLGWDRVILLDIKIVDKPSTNMPANIDVAGMTYQYIIHKDGVAVDKGVTQNLCGIRHSRPTGVLLRNDGSMKSIY